MYTLQYHLRRPTASFHCVSTWKQDCETKAFKRLAGKVKKAFPRLPIIILADSLYASEPVMEICRDNRWEEKISNGKIVQIQFQWLTGIRITERNAEKTAGAGRKHWKIENQELAQAVNEAIKESGYKKNWIAAQLGISRQALTYFLQKANFSIDDANKILSVIGYLYFYWEDDTIPFSTLKVIKKADIPHKCWDRRLFQKAKMLYVELMSKIFL